MLSVETGSLSLEKERIKLQVEQRLDELARLGFSDKIQLEEMLPEQVERRLAGLSRRNVDWAPSIS